MNVLEARRRTLGGRILKKTVTGNPAVAVGSLARRGPGIEMKGWTEQNSTEGNQLFDRSAGTDNALIQSDGSTAYSDGYGTSDYIPISPGTTYSRNLLGANGNYFYDNEKKFISNITGTSFTSPENSAFLRFSYELEKINTNLIMLNEGSAVLPWEPYTGGQPSPSPDYPQPIINSGTYDEESEKWEYEVSVGGAQLIDTDQLTIGGISGGSGVNFDAQNRIRTDAYIPVNEGNDYTLSGYSPYTIANGIVYDNSKTMIEMFINAIKIPKDGKYMRISLQKNDQSNFTDDELDDLKTTIMLNIGSAAIPYEPYHAPQTVTLQSDRPLTKWDKLEKRNGQWGWVYKSAEAVFDGDTSESWYLYIKLTDANVFYIDATNTLDKENGIEIFCNKMENVMNAYNVDRPYIISGHNNYGNVYANVKPTDADSVFDFKTWLSENPLTVSFETQNETFVPLTASEQEQMNNLYTYRPTTVLSNQQGCEMDLTYKTRKSMQQGNLLDLSKASFSRCTLYDDYSVKSNIIDSYYCSIAYTEINDLILNSIGKKLKFSCVQNPSMRISINIYGQYDDGSTYKEKVMIGQEVEIEIPNILTGMSRLELRVNRSPTPFTDTESIIRNLKLTLE